MRLGYGYQSGIPKANEYIYSIADEPKTAELVGDYAVDREYPPLKP